jgi:mannosylglucosylglycerate synthase
MRIAIVHFTAPPVAGGVESIIDKHVTLLTQDGHEVTIIAGRGEEPSERGVQFVRIPLLDASHPAQVRIAAALAHGDVPSDFSAVRDEIRSQLTPVLSGQTAVLVHNAFTLHFNTPLTAALSELAQEILRDRVVAWTHDIAVINDLYRRDFRPGYPWDLFRVPRPGVRYITISETRKEELLAFWLGHALKAVPEVGVIPNGIDPFAALRLSPAMAGLSRQVKLFQRDHVLLLPVRITRRKRIEYAIEVTAELRRRGANALLLVTGPVLGHHPARSQEYLRELKKLSTDLSLTDHVAFAADRLQRNLKDHEVTELFSLSTVLFFPSRSEGFGLPILEAGIQRLPIVAADLPVFRELASDSANFFPEDASPAVAADLVEKTAKMPAGTLRRTVLRKYAWDAVYKHKMKPFLDTIASDARSAHQTE